MIGSIRGIVTAKKESYLLIEVGGVGYKIFTTPELLNIALGSTLQVHTYLQVREDGMALFGFAGSDELDFFELLITVSGVGPKMALSILSAGNIDLIKSSISSRDVAVFTKVGGVGKKTAEKIILELRDKVTTGVLGAGVPVGSEDILNALESLGYSNKEIKEALIKIDHSLSTEEKLRQALKLLSK